MLNAEKTSSFTWKLDFDSYQSFLNATEAEVDLKCSSLEQSSRETSPGTNAWSKTTSFQHALKLAKEGWQEGLSKMQSLSVELGKISSKIMKQTYKNDLVGAWIDIGAFVSGQPDCMVTTQNEEVTGSGVKKLIKVVLNVSITNGVSSEVVAIRGACAYALVQALEIAGYNVEVIVVNSARKIVKKNGIEKKFTLSFPLKLAQETLEFDRLAFIMGNPSMNRRLCFSIKERLQSEVVQSIGFHSSSGYGTSTDVSTEEQGDIYIGCAKGNEKQWLSEANAKAWIIEQLKNQGVQLED